MAKLGDLIVHVGANTTSLDKDLGRARAQIGNFGKNLGRLGKELTIGLTAPIAAVAITSSKTAIAFEESMAKVKAISGATAGEFEQLKNNALELGRTTRYTASETAQLQLEYSKLGYSTDQILDITGATLQLAQATGSDLARSAEVAGATLNAFGLESTQMQTVVDTMAASFSSTALDMDSFAESMKYVAPVANAAGLSIQETTAMLGTLANANIKGSQAGTALRRIISELGATGGSTSEAIKELAGQGLNLADAKDEVGRSAQSALLILAEGVGTTDKLTTAFENAEGAAAGMASIMDATTGGAIAAMQSAVEGVQIEIGTALAPAITAVAGLVTSLAQGFSELHTPTKAVIGVLSLLVAALGPVLMIGTKVGANIMYINTQMRANRAAAAAQATANTGVAASMTGVAGSTTAAATATWSFSAALKSTGIGALVAVLAIAASEMLAYAFGVDEATNSEENFGDEVFRTNEELKKKNKLIRGALDGTDDASESTANLKAEVQALRNEYDNLSAKELMAVIDSYDMFSGTVPDFAAEGLNISQELANSLITGFEEVSAANAEEYDRIFNEQGEEAAESFFNGLAQGFIENQKDELDKRIAALDKELEKRQKAAQRNRGPKKQNNKTQPTGPVVPLSFTVPETELDRVMKELGDDLAEALAVFSIDGDKIAHMDAMQQAYRKAAIEASNLAEHKLSDELKAQAEALGEAATKAHQYQDQLDKVSDAAGFTVNSIGGLLYGLEQVQVKTEENKEATEEYSSTMAGPLQSAVEALGAEMVNFAMQNGETSEEMRKQHKMAIRSIIGDLLAQTVSQAITNAYSSAAATGPAAAFVGPALAAIASSTVKAMFSSIPMFAQGGIVGGPVVGMMGEYAGARHNPEVIAPLSKLKDMLGGAVQVYGTLQGSDILLSSERANIDRNRARGF